MPSYKNNATGKWYCKFYYQDWNGQRKQKKKSGFKTKREAQEWERCYLAKYSGSSDILFKDLASIFLEHTQKNRKPNTYIFYDKIISNHLAPYFGGLKITEITPNHIRTFRNKLSEKNLANSVNKVIYTALSVILNFAVRYYGLSSNPCRLCESPKSGDKKEMNYYTLGEFSLFISAIEDAQLKTIYTTLFYTGLRIGELLALTVEDIDLNQRTITVNKTYMRIERQDIIGTPKTKTSNRTIDIPKFLTNELENHIKRLYEPNKDTRIFTASKKRIDYCLKTTAQKTQLKQIRLHDFRHSHASLLINKGVQPLEIAKRLGHSDIKMTLNTYSHLYPNKAKEVANLLDNLQKS